MSETPGDTELRQWLDTRLADPQWVAKIRARSDEADAQMRAMGLSDFPEGDPA